MDRWNPGQILHLAAIAARTPVFRQVLRCLLAAALSLGGLSMCGTLQALEASLYSERFPTAIGPPQAPVTLIEIDDATLATYGGWPLPRSFFVDAAEIAFAAGASVVAIDVIFSQTGTLEDNARLVSLAARNRALVLAVDEQLLGGLFPALAQSGARFGHVKASRLADGNTAVIEQVRDFPSFSEVVYEAHCERMKLVCGYKPRISDWPMSDEFTHRQGWGIDFPFPVARIPSTSARWLMRGDSLDLRNRMVIISPAAESLNDLKSLPVENRHLRWLRAGSVALAYGVETLVRQSETWALPAAVMLLAFCALNLIATQAMAKWRWVGIAGTTGYLIACALIWWVVFRWWHLYVPVTALMLNAIFLRMLKSRF